MERDTGSYPDPTAERTENGTHPFYAPQQRSMDSADDMNSSLVHLSRELASDQNEQSHVMDQHGLPMASDQNRPQATHPHPHPQHATYPNMTPQPSYAHMHPSQPHHQLAAEANMMPTPSGPQSAEQRKKPKIRCQFNGDLTGPEGTVKDDSERCTNCTRTNSTCEFSRQPQKRGPSKGYIKELADRLQSVEQIVQGPDAHLGLSHSPPVRSEDYSRNMSQDPSRKRYRASDSHLSEPFTGAVTNYGPPDNYSQGPWAPPQQAEHPPAPSAYSPQGFSQLHIAETPSARHDQGEAPAFKRVRENSDYSSVMSFSDVTSIQLDDTSFQNYRRHIYPTFPILFHSKTASQDILGKVPGLLREAFMRALKIASTPRFLNAGILPIHKTQTADIYNLLNDPSLPGLPQKDVESKLVTLQTILLMLAYFDASGPNATRGNVSPPRGSWLGMAADLAQHMKLFELGGTKNPAELAIDKDHLKAVGQRCWWSLVIIDKWHAVGTAKASLIPESIIRLGLIDHRILGSGLFNLTRLTLSYGSIGAAYCSPFPIEFNHVSHDTFFSRTLARDLDQPGAATLALDVRQFPIIHLTYWHVKLLLARHMPPSLTKVYDIVSYANNIRQVMLVCPSGVGSLGPLGHHAVVLCAVTLSDVVDIKEKRDEALDIANALLVVLEQYRSGKPEMLNDRGMCWGNAVVAFLHELLKKNGKEDGDGLQQLADMAVGVEEGRGEKLKDWSVVGRKGFLNCV